MVQHLTLTISRFGHFGDLGVKFPRKECSVNVFEIPTEELPTQHFGPSRPSDETQIKHCHLERCQSGCSQFNANFFHFLRSKMRFNYFNEENQTKGQPNFIAVSTEKNQNRSGLI
jgi:hypothetical protein